jgi:hypothetical protein
MGDQGESQDDMQAFWADLDRRGRRGRDASDGGALQEQTWVVERTSVSVDCHACVVHGAGVIKQ